MGGTHRHSIIPLPEIASYRYSYDAVGNKTSVEELGGRTVEYSYDTLYRLVEEKITAPVEGNRTITYSFDVVGTRLSKDDSVDGLTTYTYDDNDRLLTETTNGVTTTYSYDDNGNLISEISPDKQTTYIWSSENRLMGAEITDANGTQVIEYAYDADGVRVAKTVDGDETRYLIDANRQYAQVLEEYDANTGTEVAYTYGNELISQSRGGVESVYLYDGHSGTRQLTDETGAVTDSYLYDAYGNVLKRIGDTENSYLYRGEQSDSETGLQYLRARYNDTATERFISTDPFEGMMDLPVSRHRYLYGNNNPLTFIDPSGLLSFNFNEVLSSLNTLQVLQNLASFGAIASPLQFLGSQFLFGIDRDNIRREGIQYSIDADPSRILSGRRFGFALTEGIGGDAYLINSLTLGNGQTREISGLVLAIHANASVASFRTLRATRGTFTVWTPTSLGQSIFPSLIGGYFAFGGSIFGGAGRPGVGGGGGGGLQALTMGYGRGNANGFGISINRGISFDLQLGLSIPIYQRERLASPTPDPSIEPVFGY
ncbi:MAG: RHS repeat domain-containing protein [Leptolyngbyaceae cyanobacterium]